MSRSALALLSVCLLVGSFACASPEKAKAFQTGVLSKAIAEQSYTALYRAYKDGQVAEADMAQARATYTAWAGWQARYVTTVSQGVHDPMAMAGLSAQLQLLVEMAVKYKVL